MHNISILMISNMYPSKKNVFYGVFIQNFYNQFHAKPNIVIDKVVISKKTKNYSLKILLYILFYIHIMLRLLNNKYDIVYVHNVTHSTPILRLISIFKNINLVFNFHGEDLLTKSYLSSCLLKMAKPLLLKAKLIVVPSLSFQKEVQDRIPIKNSKIFISPSGGIDLDVFKPPRTQRTVQPFTIGYVSRISRGKGWDILLSAVHLYINNSNNPPLAVIIAGDGEELPSFLKMIEKHQLQGVIQYVGGVGQSQLPFLYSKMDAFIFPTTLNESLGLVGLEAMACGVPVIGSEIGGLRSFIRDGYNGYFIQPGNYYDLLEKIQYIKCLSIDARKDLQKNAIDTAKLYDGKRNMKLLLDKLMDIASTNR